MPRVLHLIDRTAEFQLQRSAQQIAHDQASPFRATIRTIGPAGDWPNPFAAIRQLRRQSSFDLVHAWGTKALTIASMATNSKIVFSPPSQPKASTPRWLRALLSYRDIQTICPTSTLRRALITRGLPIDHCHLIRPGVDFAKISRRKNPALRERLGFSTADIVILATGESTPAANHRHAIWAAGILHVLNPKYKLLLWGRGPSANSIKRFNSRVGFPGMAAFATDILGSCEYEDLFPAADLILITAKSPIATLPIAISMAAALPIISTVTYTISELLEDHHTALMVGKPTPRLIAQRILELRENSDLQWRISDMARTEAYEYFPLTRFLNQHRTLYQQLLENVPISLPEPAPGAGLRFHGRA